MAGLFGLGRASYAPPATGLRISTSLYGRPKAIVYGQARLSPNLIDYAGFTATPAHSAGGGKGGILGAGGKGNAASYDYSVSVIASFGESFNTLLTVYNGGAIDFLVTPPPAIIAKLAAIGITASYGNIYSLEIHTGTSSQTASPFWSSAFPSRAMAYRFEGYAVFPNLGLGSSPVFPNFNFEILGNINSDIPALGPDANPADVIADFLANAVYGVPGFTSGMLANLNVVRNYWRATGLMISDALANAKAANSYLKELMTALNAEFRWTNGQLDIVPYGDVAITANGYTYTPNVTPNYDLTIDDFLPNQGSIGPGSSGGTSPVALSRKDPTLIKNKVQLEYLDRDQLYNPAVVYASDDGSIAQTWLRMSDKKSCNFFALASAAQMSAALQLHREQAGSTNYQCTVGKKYGRLEPLDLITITEPALQLVRQLCRITEIQENSDQSRVLTLEPVPLTAAAPVYGLQASLGTGRNSNAPASAINTPIFWEPPDQIGNGLVVWMGLSGSVPSNFGGCEVWVSSDNTTYKLAGEFQGTTRMGVSTAAITAVAPSTTGTTVDTTNTLAVDLTESASSLSNGSAQDFAAFNTAMLIDGEIIAYQNATLTGANKYNLAPLSRGGYGSAIAAHAIGAPIMRLDGREFAWPYTADRIGQIVYFKFLAFNPFGGGKQQLSDVGPYPYKITGATLASALPSVANLRGVYEAGVTKVWWDEVNDFRPIFYEIRKGSTWNTAPLVGIQAHPPFVAFGDDTYWISAKSTPASGITVYSATPQSIAIAGALLSQNIVISRDEKAGGWTGTFSNGAGTQGNNPNAFIQLGSLLNFLTIPNVLTTADVLYGGGIIASGSYEISKNNVIDVGYVAQCLIGCSYVGSAFPVGQNILSIADFLAQTDVLGSIAARFVDVHIEIATGTATNTDVFAPADVFAPLDAFSGPVIWGPYQKFVPGVYVARFVKFRVVLSTLDPTIVPVCLSFNYQVTVPARHDHYQNLTIPAGGLTITFQPDGASVPAGFNGGPNNQALPYLSAVWANQSADTLAYTVTSTTAFVQILNSGIGVSRSGVNIDVEGY